MEQHMTKEQKKRRAAALKATLTKQRIARFIKEFPVGEFVSTKYAYKSMGMIMSKPYRKVLSRYVSYGFGYNYRTKLIKEPRYLVKVQWHFREGKSANLEVETHFITNIKKFRPWRGFYKEMDERKKDE
jgi:hypothetical protein